MIFKLNDFDETQIVNNIYFCSCVIIDNKKYITAILGKNFISEDDKLDYSIKSSVPLAHWIYDDIIIIPENLIFEIDINLQNKKSMYVDKNSIFIKKLDEIKFDIESNNIEEIKLDILRKANKLLETYIDDISIKGLFNTILYIQKMILENKIRVDYHVVNRSYIEEVPENISVELQKEIDIFHSLLPDSMIPYLIDMDFDIIEEIDIDRLDVFLKNMQLLYEKMKLFYVFTQRLVIATTIEELKEIENNFLMTYYKTLQII